jgi:hypothetical protein
MKNEPFEPTVVWSGFTRLRIIERFPTELVVVEPTGVLAGSRVNLNLLILLWKHCYKVQVI